MLGKIEQRLACRMSRQRRIIDGGSVGSFGDKGCDWSSGGPHDSLEDARATLYCYKQMCADWQRGK